MSKSSIRERIKTASQKLDSATTNLEQVVSEMKVAPRADKVGISDLARDAFTKMRSAKTALERLNKLENEGTPLKEAITSALRRARKIEDFLRRAKSEIGFQSGDQVGEDKTAEQLDRWVAERALSEELVAAQAMAERLTQKLELLEKSLEVVEKTEV